MTLHRVAVTGTGSVSPYGKGSELLFKSLLARESAVRYHEPLNQFKELGPRVAGIVKNVDISEVPRKHRRSMSPMSVYALMASQEAMQEAAFPEEMLRKRAYRLDYGLHYGERKYH